MVGNITLSLMVGKPAICCLVAITDEKTGIGYTLCGDYYLPDLELPEEAFYELGRCPYTTIAVRPLAARGSFSRYFALPQNAGGCRSCHSSR